MNTSTYHCLLASAILLLLASCSHNTAYIKPGIPQEAQPEPALESVTQRLILIGDAGEPFKNPKASVLAQLSQRANELSDRTTVLFLGDNIYPAGLPAEDAPNRAQMEAKILQQIEAVLQSGANGIFVPGNHDWNYSRVGGQAAVQRQQQFVEARLGKNSFFPQNGCPGPVKLDLSTIRLLIIDTEWWLHKHEKGTSSCFASDPPESEQATKGRIIRELQEQIKSAGDRQVIIVGHHPLATHGPHGGFFDWKDHIFPLTVAKDWLWIPLPVVGSLYPILRWNVLRHPQDLSGAVNKEMVQRLKAAIATAAKPVIYAAGHDHGLQVLRGKDPLAYVLVSGAGAEKKITKVGHGDDTYFAHVQPGFMVLDMLANGSVFLRVVEKNKGGSGYKQAFSYWLLQ
ncbi:MAG: metallophosphoesterase [Deferribacteres bacterium]|nr:metallophosphoesterase [candidate division KSB1 bacterium]MCB9509319.1 metallophosphoesterase [Deferribacteres bacterium]